MGILKALKKLIEKVKSLFKGKKKAHEPKALTAAEAAAEKAREIAESQGATVAGEASHCPEGQVEVQDLLLVREEDYEERKKRRTHRVSLYVFLRNIPVDIIGGPEFDDIVEKAFDLAVNHIEGGTLEPLLRAALDPMDYSIDTESAVYCDTGEPFLDDVSVVIITNGRPRKYSTVVGEPL